MGNNAPNISLPAALQLHLSKVLNRCNSGDNRVFPQNVNARFKAFISHPSITTNIVMRVLVLKEVAGLFSHICYPVLDIFLWYRFRARKGQV